jgi:radical SAM superfamily enzyme YgiQ (UPF0313 family)
MKISLVEPKAPDYHIFSKFPLPRLGLPLLGTMLARRGHDVRVYAECLARLGPADFRELLRSDLVGISITTSTAPAGYRLGHTLKIAGVPVVYGGPHASYCADEALKHGDYVVRGEGEEATLELADALAAHASPAGIGNLSHHAGDVVVHEPSRPFLADLDGLPWPDFTLMKRADRMHIYPLATSRGCPRFCDFCSVAPLFGRKIRRRDAADVVAEVRRVTQRTMFIVDDNFTVNRRYTAQVCAGLARLKDRPSWIAQAGVDIGRDETLIKLMKRAGCFALALGLESVNDDTLAAYNKGQSTDDIVHCLEVLHRHGIWVHGMFVLGGEADGPGAAAATVAFARKHKIGSVQLLALTPIPGTPLYARLESEGRIFNHDWSLYDGQHVVFEPARMTPLELQVGLIDAYREFYSLRHVNSHLRQLQWYAAITTYYGHRLIRKWYSRKGELLQLLANRSARAAAKLAAAPRAVVAHAAVSCAAAPNAAPDIVRP